MTVSNFFTKLFLFSALFCCVVPSFAQDEKKITRDDEALKISTELIQTGVAIFDKKGKFVNNIKKEDFELLVDGKPVSISFFEPNTIKSGDITTEIRTEKNDVNFPESNKTLVRTLTGRTIIFVVDDIHLSMDTLSRTRKLILKFIDREMLPEDKIAVVSTTGKIGSLQQFTNDKTVLRAAAERLKYTQDWSAADRSSPPIKEYEAQMIDRQDQELIEHLAKLTVEQTSGSLRIEDAREMVRARARAILSQASVISKGMYSALEQAIRDSAKMPGRKIALFISDGFIMDSANTDSTYSLRRITDAAARTNTVIYSFSAKGLDPDIIEGTAMKYRAQTGERFELQDGLNFLAETTGGRFVKDTNDLQSGLTNSLEEASQYYLLAWEPFSENGKRERLRKIEVKVKNRPELKIRVQSGYLDGVPKSKDNEPNKNKQEKKN